LYILAAVCNALAYFRKVAYVFGSWFLIASRSFDEKIV
jgi:hypothetical protein